MSQPNASTSAASRASRHALAWAAEADTGCPTDKLVLVSLASFRNHKTGDCFPSLESLAERSGYHRATVVRAIERLEAHGLLEVVKTRRKGRQGSNRYELLMGSRVAQSDPDRVAQSDPDRVAQSDPNKEGGNNEGGEQRKLTQGREGGGFDSEREPGVQPASAPAPAPACVLTFPDGMPEQLEAKGRDPKMPRPELDAYAELHRRFMKSSLIYEAHYRACSKRRRSAKGLNGAWFYKKELRLEWDGAKIVGYEEGEREFNRMYSSTYSREIELQDETRRVMDLKRAQG